MNSRNLIILGVGGYVLGAAGSVVGMAAVLRRKYRGRGYVPARSRRAWTAQAGAYRPKSILRGRLDGPDIDIVVVPYSDPRGRA